MKSVQVQRFDILIVSLIFAAGAGVGEFASAKSKKAARPPLSAKAKAAPLADLKLVEGDEKGNEIKSLKAELLVSSAEEKAVSQMQKLIKKHKGTALEPDLQFRLAELYMRRSKTDRFFEVHRESETIVRLVPKIVREASPRKSVTQAVDTYAEIQRRFTTFEQMDLVIYNHAFARQVLGQDKEAEVLYWTLVQNFPRSLLVPDAHLAIGEIAFGKSQFQTALEHFDAIKAFPRSKVYPYGLYKAAWTLYNMREGERGLKKLEEVVAFGRSVAQSGIDARLDLRKEALNDMTLFYEDVYPSKDVYKYFRVQASEAEVGPIVLRMATLYERHSRFQDQRVVLDQFIAELPHSPLLPKVHTDLVIAHEHLRDKARSVARLEEFAKLCEAGGDWVKSQGKTSEETKQAAGDCLTALNETALKLAKKWLRAWKKLPSDTTYADASEKAFEIYLRRPESNDELSQSRFAYAELLFARQKFRQASNQYSLVKNTKSPVQAGKAKAPPVSPEAAKLDHDASYGALVSLEKAVGNKWTSEDEQSFHQLAESYVKDNPKGQYRLDIEYKMALLAYEKERFDESAPRFLRLGREFPTQEKGQKSQDLYLDILNIKKDYRGIRNYSQELMKTANDSGRQLKMRKLYEQAYFLEVQGLEEKGQLKVALREYQDFSKSNPDSELTEKAMWNSLQLQTKLGEGWAAAKTAEEFADKYPTSAQTVNALLRAAQTFEQMAQLGPAARVLEKLALRDPKAAARWKELAADFYALDGQAGNSRRILNELKVGADGETKTRLFGKLESLEKNYGTDQTHADILKAMIDQNIQPQASQAKVEVVERLYKKGQSAEAFNEARRVLGGGLTNAHKARVRLVQAKVLEAEFMSASVKARAERIATVLSIKTEKLEKAQQAFQAAIKYGEPRVSLEAFEHLYACYSHYVKALKDMPAPTGLKPDEAKAFREELANLVVPLEEKSVDTLAQAVDFARKQQFLDGTTERLETELNRLNQKPSTNIGPELTKPDLVLPMLVGVNP